MNVKELIELEETKNVLSKDLANHKESIAIKSDERKISYAKFLYGLKEAHSTTMFNQSMARIDKIHNLREK